ncbi:MAG: VWA domain-containing protein [Acholeplasmataceae bacterium]|nr:VWA domain-containing protein [Acholeplasmataceae bacterium]
MKKFILGLTMGLMLICLSACSNDMGRMNWYSSYDWSLDENRESYAEITENPFVKTEEDATSTFSMDTSTAGYANLRRLINQGATIQMSHVKIEEMVNYFDYSYPAPEDDSALRINSEMMVCPWNDEHYLLSVGVKAKELDVDSPKLNNLVFLLDVSGSMNYLNKLPLMQAAFKMFVETLNDDDTVSVVVYAGKNAVLLEGAKGSEKKRIVNIIEDLQAGGSTAGSKGIRTAYTIASKYFIQGGNNRVILGTDGDFNVGISSVSDLEKFISEKRETGVYFSVLGFGYGNLQDDKLETLAQNGNGNYAYIDSITEAKKVLVEEIDGTLNIVSKDTKAQVTFNPRYISEYRLLGYENQLLTDEEFEDENADAGEIGAGHEVTAVYEIVLNEDDTVESTLEDDWAKVLIRHKDPDTGDNKEISASVDVSSILSSPSADMLFISCVVETGLILRDSEYKGTSSLDNVITRLQGLALANDPYKTEFLELV